MTLNNLGVLHRDQNRMDEARAAYDEALNIYQHFAAINPAQYSKHVARVTALIAKLPSRQ